MPASDGGASDAGTSLLAHCRALTDSEGEARRERALELSRCVLSNVEGIVDSIDEVSSDCVDHLEPRLADDDPTVRSAVVAALGFVAHLGDDFDVDRSRFVPTVLECMDDDSALVRQTVLAPSYAPRIVEDALGDEDEFEPKSPAWLADRVFERLRDPSPTVRKRAAAVLWSNRDALTAAHPDQDRALAALVGALDDPVDGLGGNHGKSRTPRKVALDVLREAPGFHDALAADHLDDVTPGCWDDDKRVRWSAIRLLRELVETDVVALDRVAPTVADAIVDGQYPYANRGFDFAVSVALAEPRAMTDVTALLVGRLTESDTSDRWMDLDHLLDAISRLVAESDRSFDPAIETLAAQVAADDVDTGDRDPLRHLADPHPEFVADVLREGYAALPDSKHGATSRFGHEFAAAIADQNPRAVAGVPEVMAANVAYSHVAYALYELAAAHPDVVAPVAQSLLDDDEIWTVPVTRWHAGVLEATIDHLPAIPDTVVDALAATVESLDGSAKDRRFALRALLAADDHDLARLPTHLEPLRDPAHAGAFDETSDLTDPLDTDAAIENDIGNADH